MVNQELDLKRNVKYLKWNVLTLLQLGVYYILINNLTLLIKPLAQSLSSELNISWHSWQLYLISPSWIILTIMLAFQLKIFLNYFSLYLNRQYGHLNWLWFGLDILTSMILLSNLIINGWTIKRLIFFSISIISLIVLRWLTVKAFNDFNNFSQNIRQNNL